jgi:hypothetical protein
VTHSKNILDTLILEMCEIRSINNIFCEFSTFFYDTVICLNIRMEFVFRAISVTTMQLKGSSPRALFESVVPSALRENVDGSVILSMIVPLSFPQPHPFPRP